jgi:hypothetical protein
MSLEVNVLRIKIVTHFITDFDVLVLMLLESSEVSVFEVCLMSASNNVRW